MIAAMPRTMLLTIVFLVSAALDGLMSRAIACDCGCWTDRRACVVRFLAGAHLVIVGKVISTHEYAQARGDPLIVARVSVEKSIKGVPPAEVLIESAGGDNSANCGIGRALLQAQQESQSIVLVLGTRRRNRFPIGRCDQVREDELR